MAKIETSKGMLYFSPKTIYPGIKQIDKEIAFENLKMVAEIMNSSGLKWGPVYGSLLGIIRDNDFITWDEDIDLFILEEEKEKFLPLLFDFKALGFEVIRNWRCGLISIMRNGEYIDFYILKKIGDGVRSAIGVAYLFEKNVTDMISWDFKGIKLPIPRDYEEFLEFKYGDWKTPVQYMDYEMNSFMRWKTKTRLYIINHLPDFLYYPLFRRHHQKDLNKFINTCRQKGVVIPPTLTLDNFKKQ